MTTVDKSQERTVEVIAWKLEKLGIEGFTGQAVFTISYNQGGVTRIQLTETSELKIKKT